MPLNDFLKNRVAVITLLVITVSVNFYFFGYLDHKIPVLEGDEGEYHAYAANIVQNGTYSHNKTPFSAWREPGYILFVSGIYKMFGVGNFRAVHIAQAVLMLIMAFLIYSVFLHQKQPSPGLLGSLLVAGNPYFAHLSARLLQEMFYAFLLAVVFYLISEVMRRIDPTPARIMSLGLAIGILTLTRLQFMYFPLILIGAGYIWKGSFAIFTGKNSIRLLIFFSLPLILWGLYVMSQSGKFMLQESRVDVQLYVRAERVKESWPELIKYSGLQVQNTLLGKRDPWWWQKDYRYYIDGYEIEKTPISDSVRTIISHPAKYILGSITEFLKLISLYHAFNAPYFSKYVRIVWYAMLYGISIWGLFRCLKKRVMPDMVAVAVLILAYNAVIISCFNAAPVYNVPLHTLYIIIGLAGFAVYNKEVKV